MKYLDEYISDRKKKDIKYFCKKLSNHIKNCNLADPVRGYAMAILKFQIFHFLLQVWIFQEGRKKPTLVLMTLFLFQMALKSTMKRRVNTIENGNISKNAVFIF